MIDDGTRMTGKVKRGDSVVPEMRQRLMENRGGKMTVSQWLDIVMQPVGALIALSLTAGVVMLPRTVMVLARGGWFFLLVLLAVIVVTMAFRAYRYARQPVHFAEMQAEVDTPPLWMFWRGLKLQAEDGKRYHLRKRLAPRPFIKRGERYIVYYLQDEGGPVLLSIAPTAHPDSERWQPTKQFDARYRRRAQD